VNIVSEASQTTEPKFWSSWRGRIIRAIVLDRLYKRNEILKRTQLQEKQFEQALGELFQKELLEETDKDRFLVSSRELCNEYRTFFKKLQQNLVDWVNQWRLLEKVEVKLNHFFLEDRLLYEFSEKSIENAKVEILIANPYVRRCHISETLKSMSEKGINVKLITRPTSENYVKRLSEKGVSVTSDESVHAKLIVVDRRVGIASSMNFFSGSSGGASWEAGLVTIEESTVKSVAGSILNKT
jgi:phosphatidylserine/phosphatidylglycerophosphate/cardiolipin synthase-like enzyme